MDGDISELCDALDQLLAHYARWEEPLHRYHSENLERINRDGFTWDMFERGLKKLEASVRTEYDPHPELFRLLERLCTLYLRCDVDGRAEVRAFVAERRRLGGLVWSYANHLATQINHLRDAPLLRVALAAVSIENCGSDYRDTLTTLADLFVRAEEVGVDPKPFFEAISDLSSNGHTTGGCESLADMLRTFESYAVVGERRAQGKPYSERP